jgi:ectoine hydroxylase-related dioxygenase (phytanoyl-CoA dioxygenase family)
LPNSPPPAENYRGAHSEALYDTYWRLQIAAYIDDLPAHAGGLTLWPGSHQRIWDYWEAVHRDAPPPDRAEGTPKWDGYTVPPLADIKSDTEPVATEGPVGSVVLWHANLLHMAGQNTLSDVIRQATIYAFAKTPESVPDEVVMRDPSGDLWRDWSDEVCSIEAAK